MADRPVGPGRAVPGPRERPPPRPEQYGAVPHIDSGILPICPSIVRRHGIPLCTGRGTSSYAVNEESPSPGEAARAGAAGPLGDLSDAYLQDYHVRQFLPQHRQRTTYAATSTEHDVPRDAASVATAPERRSWMSASPVTSVRRQSVGASESGGARRRRDRCLILCLADVERVGQCHVPNAPR